ncbi:MAG: tetratricopeptide repeat protein, partial [Candidatus Omnitrophota bacterium]
GKFLWDDNAFIKSNQYVKSLSTLPQLFTKNFGQGVGKRYLFYRPLQMATYALDYSIWKLDPRGYHITNIILHILASLGVYWITSLLFKDKRLSLFTAALFAIHPIHVGAVSSIAGRADPLVAVFLLAAFALYIKNTGSWGIGRYLAIVSLYICALLSRENSLIFPLILLLYHYIFRVKPRKIELLTISTIACMYAIIRFALFRTALLGSFGASTFLERAPGSLAALVDYIRLLFIPTRLHMIYGKSLFSWTDPVVIAGTVIFALLIVSTIKARGRDRLYTFGVLWFLITLLPQANLYPINAYMAEHWLYIPSIGFFLILGRALLYLYNKRGLAILAYISIFVLISFYSTITVKQNSYWKDPVIFYKKTLEYNPQSEWMYNNLGNALYARGEKDEAIDAYKKAVELKPDFDYAYYNLATAYSSIGRDAEAVSFFKKAIDANLYYAHAYNNLGVSYYKLQKKDTAVSAYRKAIEIKPDYADAHFNLGNALFSLGKVAESLDAFNKAIEIDRYHISAYHNMATVYLRTKDTKKAVEIYNKILKLDPNHPLAHKNISIAYFREGRYALAAKHCERAIELGCEMDPEFIENLKKYKEK